MASKPASVPVELCGNDQPMQILVTPQRKTKRGSWWLRSAFSMMPSSFGPRHWEVPGDLGVGSAVVSAVCDAEILVAERVPCRSLSVPLVYAGHCPAPPQILPSLHFEDFVCCVTTIPQVC